MKRSLFFSICMIFVLSSCHYFEGKRVDGDGNVISQARSVTDFKGVEVGGAIELYLTQDSAYSVKVETDNNLQEFIEVYKEGDILRVRTANNINLDPTGDRIKVYVSAPSYRKIGASGACKVIAQNKLSHESGIDIDLSGASEAQLEIQAPNVDVEASGACNLTMRGQTKDLTIDGSGSTEIKAFDLLSENADIELSGAGDVDIYASVKVDARTSGSSSIRYKGNATVSSDISGAGSVKKVD